MGNMRFKVGDRVRIKSLDWYYDNRDRIDEVACGNTNFIPDMVKYCEEIITISSVLPTLGVYHIKEDGGTFNWTDEMIEGLVEEEVDLIPKFGEYSDNEPLDIPTMTTDFVKEHGLPCPDGYEFRDEDGNIIEAKKIVLEKKKPKYPTKFTKCCEILYPNDNFQVVSQPQRGHKGDLLFKFQKLLICRDAYWKIAGEEMGLGKPWEPDWRNSEQNKYVISNDYGRELNTHKIKCSHVTHILAFPSEEMRDALYENFKKLIEQCKEFL